MRSDVNIHIIVYILFVIIQLLLFLVRLELNSIYII